MDARTTLAPRRCPREQRRAWSRHLRLLQSAPAETTDSIWDAAPSVG